MTTATDERITVAGLVQRTGISHLVACSWARAWHGPSEMGGRTRSLTPIDVMVALAWVQLGSGTGYRREGYGDVPARHRAIERVVRTERRRWLLLAGHRIETFDTAEEAALAWATSGQPAGQLIDLDPESDAA